RNKAIEVGKNISKDARTPPMIRDIVSSLQSVDVAYHMHHRKNGVPMFDPNNGGMLEGIGHYRPSMQPGARQIDVEVVDVPYPCDLDRGILVGFAQRYEPGANLEHLSEAMCRSRGHDRCRYAIRW